MLFWAFIPIALILSSVALVAAIQYRKDLERHQLHAHDIDPLAQRHHERATALDDGEAPFDLLTGQAIDEDAGPAGHNENFVGTDLLTVERRDDDAAVSVLRAGLEAGIDLFDTADAYARDEDDRGHNDRLIARALEAWPGTHPLVVTKGGLRRPQGRWAPDGRGTWLREACEASRRALGVEQIDPYLLRAIDPKTSFATCVRRAGQSARARHGGENRALQRQPGPNRSRVPYRAGRGSGGGARALRARPHEPRDRPALRGETAKSRRASWWPRARGHAAHEVVHAARGGGPVDSWRP